jgi:hypothetical protein
MARARLIKPGFFENERLAELPALTRLLFAGLWCIADREGRLEDRPNRIRAQVLPYDRGNVDHMLTQLQDAGFILRYARDSHPYIQVLSFARHQSPHVREPASIIPAPDEHSASPVLVPVKTGTGPAVYSSGSSSGEVVAERDAAAAAVADPITERYQEYVLAFGAPVSQRDADAFSGFAEDFTEPDSASRAIREHAKRHPGKRLYPSTLGPILAELYPEKPKGRVTPVMFADLPIPDAAEEQRERDAWNAARAAR